MKKITYFVELLTVIRNNSNKIQAFGLKSFIEKLPDQGTSVTQCWRTRRSSTATSF